MKLIKFKLDNCVPCKMAEKFISENIGKQVDETYLLSSNDPKAHELAAKYGIMSAPTFLLIDEEGTVIDRVQGQGQTKLKAIFAKRFA